MSRTACTALSACTEHLYLYLPEGLKVCTEPHCLYSTAKPIPLLGPYGLYSVSLPVQYSNTSTTLRAVRSLESLCACRVQLYFYHP